MAEANVIRYRGKPITELSRDELLKAMEYAGHEIISMRNKLGDSFSYELSAMAYGIRPGELRQMAKLLQNEADRHVCEGCLHKTCSGKSQRQRAVGEMLLLADIVEWERKG